MNLVINIKIEMEEAKKLIEDAISETDTRIVCNILKRARKKIGKVTLYFTLNQGLEL